MKYTIWIKMVLAIMTVTFFSGCQSVSINIRDIPIKPAAQSGAILNLRNYGDFNKDLVQQSERIMKSGFLNKESPEWGYYQIDWGYRYNGSSDWFNKNTFFFILLPFVTPTHFVGIPIGTKTYYVTTCFRIFDSRGSLVYKNEKEEWVTRLYGLYYDLARGKAPRRISELLNEQLAEAASGADEINARLKRAGPITETSDGPALAAIAKIAREDAPANE